MSQSATTCLLNSQINWPLYSVEVAHKIELTAITSLPQHKLMKRAGLVIAKLAIAISPHASKIWIACGHGNSGGDGLEAAAHLKIWGKQPIINWSETQKHCQRTQNKFLKMLVASISIFRSTRPNINLSGNALLSSTRTGDVQAGLIGVC